MQDPVVNQVLRCLHRNLSYSDYHEEHHGWIFNDTERICKLKTRKYRSGRRRNMESILTPTTEEGILKGNNDFSGESQLPEGVTSPRFYSDDSDMYSDSDRTITDVDSDVCSPGRSLSVCSDDLESFVSEDADTELDFSHLNDDLDLITKELSNTGLKNDDVSEFVNHLKDEDNTIPMIRVDNRPVTDATKMPAFKFAHRSQSPMLFEDREFNFEKQELRRSTSLKTSKTPPGTPGRKKVVRFADALGLDLESVRHILNMEAPPLIPISAIKDLKDTLDEEQKTQGSKILSPMFEQPGSRPDFIKRVHEKKVCLENALISGMTVMGTVRVSNINFDKTVRVRYTFDNWNSFLEAACTYVQDSCDGSTDRFSFTISVPPEFNVGHRMEVALCFRLPSGQAFWDNNDDSNYGFTCFAKASPTVESDSSWMHFV
ncbi:unnamed protein product [Owenia fusiformis]|uniref:Uncharacterized protein n=1 Tax=Owenia fusiformis TaxID=6347 RepID=A0A8J1Y7D0_OWEFU|nr:unnamed protein product [Owenia fusiformis]